MEVQNVESADIAAYGKVDEALAEIYPDEAPKPEADDAATEQAGVEGPSENEVEPPAIDGDDEPAGPGEVEEPADVAIEAPSFWSAEEKEKFKALTALGGDAAVAAAEVARIANDKETERSRYIANAAREAAVAKQTADTQARSAVQEIYQAHAQQLEQYAQMLLPQAPDDRLLYTGNPQDGVLYLQQKAQYDADVSKHQTMQSQAAEARAQASAIAAHQDLLARQALGEELASKLGTEWTDQSARQKLQDTLYPIGKELGYSDEAMADANASDILALKKAHSWYQDHLKYRDMMKRQMTPVRAAKQLPRSMQPGSSGAQPSAKRGDFLKDLYPND